MPDRGAQFVQPPVHSAGAPLAPHTGVASAGRTAVVVEGGGMRGIFAAGVLDAFAEHAFAPFDLAIGTSAGAAALASHMAGQPDRSRRCLTGLMCRPEFVHRWKGPWRAIRRGHWMDLDWLLDACDREDPLDVAALLGCGVELLVTTTSADSGEPVYLEPRADDASTLLKASSALPILYRGPVLLRGQRLVDGGVAAPIPVREAYRRGARRILVVRTRARGVTKQVGFEHYIGALALRDYPALARAIWRSPAEYQASLDFIAHPPADCAVLEVAPSQPLATRRTTQSLAALEQDYAVGRACGEIAMRSWAAMDAHAVRPPRLVSTVRHGTFPADQAEVADADASRRLA
jgi:predicted patatin/cPLA2 family phospholipase